MHTHTHMDMHTHTETRGNTEENTPVDVCVEDVEEAHGHLLNHRGVEARARITKS